MNNIAIQVEDLAKRYQLGGTRSLDASLREAISDTARRVFRRVRGNREAASQEFWALNGVSFNVERGQVLGVIGRNGAGKSTLLKILSQITLPTRGQATIKGRVGSLLEVGTGFHPELSGRENIYLNGTILGMRKSEIDRKFDQIVDFAEIEQFLDTPVKRYSSGMYVRLAFAVAAHLEPEILLVDEVLAVGDAGFQKKCLGKMNDVAGNGRTVLFVSHNMGAINQLCQKALLLDKGGVKYFGEPAKAVAQYLELVNSPGGIASDAFMGTLSDRLRFDQIQINGETEAGQPVINPGSSITLRVTGECLRSIANFRFTFSIFRDGVRLVTQHDLPRPQTLPAGRFDAHITIPPYFLRPGQYSLAIGGFRDGMDEWIWGKDLNHFTVMEQWDDQYDVWNIGMVNLPHNGGREVQSTELKAA